MAGHTVRRDDGRWSERMLGWQPERSFDARGHPCKRWTDDLDAFFYRRDGLPTWIWKAIAQDRQEWQILESEFVAQTWHI